MSDYILWLHEVEMSDVDRVGGKNASLGEMLRNEGFQVRWISMYARDHERGRPPDRVDALVWGLTELMLKNKGGWVI